MDPLLNYSSVNKGYETNTDLSEASSGNDGIKFYETTG